MSFIDLMASDVWSEADIIRRTEAMVRQYFSADAEKIINRKLQGAALGQYALSAEEMAEVARFNEVVFEARAAGDAARADMAVLNEVLTVEPAFLRLRQPELEPEFGEDGQVLNQDALDQDTADRMAAQALVDVASVQVLDLLIRRNPPPPEPEVVEETEPADSPQG